ncbi:MAG TPA: TIGR03936 family radical SAM-associated protein [Gemmataceae bacterium]|nr:TIGR03936 family radical SAM-associated protein [Gemmataceae bacterium]
MVQDKFRLRFRKGSSLRLLSHHDLMRCFERMLRRAALPFHNTQGFHPHPRIVFALSLPLGVVGCEEVAELELDEVLAPDEVLERLRRQAPPGIEILSVQRVPPKATAQVRSLSYRLPLPPERVAAVREQAARLLASSEVWLTRSKPQPGQVPLTAQQPDPEDARATRVDLRPFLRGVRIVDLTLRVRRQPPHAEREVYDGDGTSANATALEVDLWLTPSGTARPVEVLGLLGLTDLLEAGAVLERSRLELHDENCSSSVARSPS